MQTRLLHGFHAVIARLRQNPDSVRTLYVDETRQDGRMRDLLRQAELVGAKLRPIDPRRLNGLAPGTRHQGVVAEVDEARPYVTLDDVLDTLEEPPLLLILDGVTDPRNVGACLRVADAVGAHAVVAPKDRAAGLTDVAVKAASGAAETVPYVTVTNLARCLRDLKARNIWVVGTDGDAEQDIYSASWPKGMAWVLGAEGEGMRRLTREICDELVRIPMHGSVDSLNVSVAAGICLFEARRRLSQ